MISTDIGVSGVAAVVISGGDEGAIIVSLQDGAGETIVEVTAYDASALRVARSYGDVLAGHCVEVSIDEMVARGLGEVA